MVGSASVAKGDDESEDRWIGRRRCARAAVCVSVARCRPGARRARSVPAERIDQLSVRVGQRVAAGGPPWASARLRGELRRQPRDATGVVLRARGRLGPTGTTSEAETCSRSRFPTTRSPGPSHSGSSADSGACSRNRPIDARARAWPVRERTVRARPHLREERSERRRLVGAAPDRGQFGFVR
jgi:hypothetical protein